MPGPSGSPDAAARDRGASPDAAAWWKRAVIYQVYPRSFLDSNADGVGDLAGVAARLDHIVRLGVDAIWLSPFFVSPQADFGYDIADHCRVDPLFGTMDDFDRLVDAAHRAGLKVLIDQVWSHTSVEHAWFASSRTDPRGAHGDWYVWADPRPDGTPPNNWLSVFGGAAWTWDAGRRQYYLHHFLPSQPQLNLHNPRVRAALMAGGEFWLKRGVDGFRLDAVDFYFHDPQLRDNPPAPVAAVPMKPFAMQQHHFDMLHDGLPGFLREIRALADRFGAVTLAEVSSQDGAFDRILRYTDGRDALHLAYTLRLSREAFRASTFRELIEAAGRSEFAGTPCWSFNNHDVERAVSRWAPRGAAGVAGVSDVSVASGTRAPTGAPDMRLARLLMALALSLDGAACLYQGEELGLTESRLAREDLRDPFGINYYPQFRGRDGSRTPMPWDAARPHAGFTEAARPWLPVPPEHHRLAAKQAWDDADSLPHAYRRFIAWRRATPGFAHAPAVALDAPEPVLAFRRGDVLCLFNLGTGQVEVDARGATALDGHGFDARVAHGRAVLAGHGVFFGRLPGGSGPARPDRP